MRTGPGVHHAIASDRSALTRGSIIRVYNEQDNWFKISKSADHWVSGRFTKELQRYIVKPKFLNVRSGPGTEFYTVDRLKKDEHVFISEVSDGWARMGREDRWVSKRYLEGF